MLRLFGKCLRLYSPMNYNSCVWWSDLHSCQGLQWSRYSTMRKLTEWFVLSLIVCFESSGFCSCHLNRTALRCRVISSLLRDSHIHLVCGHILAAGLVFILFDTHTIAEWLLLFTASYACFSEELLYLFKWGSRWICIILGGSYEDLCALYVSSPPPRDSHWCQL